MISRRGFLGVLAGLVLGKPKGLPAPVPAPPVTARRTAVIWDEASGWNHDDVSYGFTARVVSMNPGPGSAWRMKPGVYPAT